MPYRKSSAPKSGKPEIARNTLPAMRSAFPAVDQLRVELEFDSGDKWSPASQVHILHPAATASFRYPCPMSGCSGHFELDNPVSGLLKKSAGVLADNVTCCGVRPEDRFTGKACALHLKYRVEATYSAARRR
jgi:hypothetical protein